jgi:hypothetical protein
LIQPDLPAPEQVAQTRLRNAEHCSAAPTRFDVFSLAFNFQPLALPQKMGSFCVKKTDTFAERHLCKIRVCSRLQPDDCLKKLGSFCEK